MKIVSLFAYCLIFIPGSMIMLPMGMLLLYGLFSGALFTSVLFLLSLTALVIQVIFFFRQLQPVVRLCTDIACFILLLLPVVNMLINFGFKEFSYFLFLFPAGCFILLFPVSAWLQYRKCTREEKKNAGAISI